MNTINYWNTTLGLTLAGTLFSGYLAGTKLFTGSCALTEPCPYVWGYPACVFGFVLFAFMLLVSLRGRFLKGVNVCRRVVGVVSLAGILFAGYLVFDELPYIFSGATTYSMGLPSCAYGLIFYIVVFIISLIPLSKDAAE